MNTKRLRIIIPLVIIAIIGIGFAVHTGIGTLSAIGWQDISLLCPLGALLTMLSTKTVIPRAMLSLALAIVIIVLFARAFCGWICPVPIVSKLRGIFSKKTSNTDLAGTGVLKPNENPLLHSKNEEAEKTQAPLSAHELNSLKNCKHHCSTCAEKRTALDSRHIILGGSVLSAFVFGFPVFCLICPIGLTFATIVILMRLFAFGDITWGVVAIPAVLLIEVVFFRKWCSTFCPLSAFMSLIGKANRTFIPAVDDNLCRESSKGSSCEACAAACPQGINVRHPEVGASFSECIKCRACVDACPEHAITMPLLPPAKIDGAK